jgi:urease accessory protein
MLSTVPLGFPALLPAPRAGSCSQARQPPRAGEGRLEVRLVDGCSAVTGCAASSPLQLLAPRPRGQAAWIVSASHGGGLVAGDAVELQLSVGPGAAACLGTQAETKVYRAAGAGGASQRLSATVGDGALLAFLPDPVSPFAGSSFDQVQRFELAAGASLVVLDSVTAGRPARGERWALHRYGSRNEVRSEGRLVLADGLVRSGADDPDLVVDIATLTGAQVVALGHHHSGILANDAQLARELVQAGERADDRAWQLPLTEEYAEQLKSPFADFANVAGRDGGTIMGKRYADARGTVEMLLNTIAERILGLPQDHRPDKSVPFNRIPG